MTGDRASHAGAWLLTPEASGALNAHSVTSSSGQQRWPAAPTALLGPIRRAHHVAQRCEAGPEQPPLGAMCHLERGCRRRRTHRAIGWRS
jgi:hypothetical protein